VARYGEACKILVPDPGESRARVDFLRRACDDAGRDFAEIQTTSLIEVDPRPGRMSSGDVTAAIRAQIDEGIGHVIVNMPNVDDPRHIQLFAREILPAIADLAGMPA
jgi:hypothetical protein